MSKLNRAIPSSAVGAGFACPDTQSKLFSGERTSPLRTKRQHYPRFDTLSVNEIVIEKVQRHCIPFLTNERRLKGRWGDAPSLPEPHRRGVSTTNERRKGETGFPFVRWKTQPALVGSAIVWQAIDGKVREPGLHPVPVADFCTRFDFSPPPSCAYMRARNIVMCLHILPVLSLSKSSRYVLL